MAYKVFTRRDFLKAVGAVAAGGALAGSPIDLLASAAQKRLIEYPEKTGLHLLTSRPPNLETPLHYFKELVTPNNALFVRWHITPIPISIDLSQWRLNIGGNVDSPLALSYDDLRTKFEKVVFTAVIQCAGNGRAFFEPRVPGAQWKNGAMGNITWTGCRVRDVLGMAGIKPGSVDVAFDGLDRGTIPSVPDYVKSLPVDKALEEDVIIAYEMNGEPLSMLNGFPVRLVVPGWYATYWVKSLSDITVTDAPFEQFWMKTAYRIPDTACGCVEPGGKPKKTVPINRMTTRSLIIEPMEGAVVKRGRPIEIMGIAFSGGYSIKDVVVSTDGGRSWAQAKLGRDLGRYSWIQFRYPWRPAKQGRYKLMAKATNSIGESQPVDGLWNPSGYLWNKIEGVEVDVK